MSTHAANSETPFLPELEIDGPSAQRRWTVLIRLILLIPHFIVLYFVGIAAAVVAVLAWVAGVILGRIPAWLSDFLALFVAYEARVNAYALLLVDQYPPFVTTTAGFPVRADIRPGTLNRAAVLFRIILVIPAALVSAVVLYGWLALSFFLWLAVLIIGRTPMPLFGANSAVLRFSYRTRAYFFMLTGAYPKRLFGDGADQAATEAAEQSGDSTGGAVAVGGTRPLLLTQGARTLLIIYLVLGVLALIGGALAPALMGGPMEYQPGHYGVDGY